MRLGRGVARGKRRLRSFWERFALFLLGVCIVSGGLLLYFSDLLRVQSLVCLCEGKACPEVMWLTIFASYKGRSLLRISPKQTALEIQEFFDELESVRVSKHWPRGMEVNVVFRRPVLRLCLGELPEKSEDSFIPPSEANCQSYSLQASELLDEDRQLPRFFAASRPLLLIKELVELSSYLQKANILIGDGWVPRQEHSVVIFVGGRKIVFSLEKDLVNQVDSLQAILSRSTMMDKPVSQVDFRFEKPVVRFVE